MEMLKSVGGDREGLTEFEQTHRHRNLVVEVWWEDGAPLRREEGVQRRGEFGKLLVS